MSENRDRRTDEFSKYDSMTTEELEEILRLDAEAPEEQESDTELLLYVMGVLANRRNNTDNTGKTALEAWESFQQHYLPAEEEDPGDMKKSAKRFSPWLRRLVTTAAVIALVLCLPLSANAFGWEDIWDIFARWAKETFYFVSSETAEVSEPSPTFREDFTSLQEMLDNSNRESNFIPTWIPDGFVLKEIVKNVTPSKEIYNAFYVAGDKELIMWVQTYLASDAFNIEIEEDSAEIYTASGVDYYIFKNINQIQVVWTIQNYECSISGDLSIQEAKKMIDSIGEG